MLLLGDCDLMFDQLSMVDIMKQTEISNVVLVTDHYFEVKAQKLAKEADIKILPRELIPAVTIKLDEKIIPNSKKVDAVWVDDALGDICNLIHKDYGQLKIDIFDDPVIFLEKVSQYSLNTKIILDMYFYFDHDERAKTMNGLSLASKLHAMGYNNLYFCTAENLERSKIPPYLKVVAKSEIYDRQNLSMFGF